MKLNFAKYENKSYGYVDLATFIFTKSVETLDVGRVKKYFALDLETYGKISTLPRQEQFHPRKAIARDGVARKDLIACVGLTYRKSGTPGEREGLWSTVLPWDKKGRRILAKWLKYIHKVGGTTLWMNAAFDVQFLRFCDRELAHLLTSSLGIWDLGITNALYDSERPERKLKDISTILGLGAYTEKPEDRHPSKYSERLWEYVVEDTEKTLLCQEILELELEERGIPITPECRDFYHDTIWSLISKSEAGTAVSLPKLRKLDRLLDHRMNTLWSACREEGLLLGNRKGVTGSDKEKRAFMQEIFEIDGMPTMELTDTGLPKISDDQILTALTSIRELEGEWESGQSPLTDTKRKLKAMRFYSKLRKLQGTYVGRILRGGKTGPHKACQHIKGIVYPSWFPVPTYEKDESGEEGGTRQIRLAAKGPAIQTFPPPVKRCCCSRWKDGSLLGKDAKQLELRGAALLSGDPLMMEDYQRGEDRHKSTALLLVELGIVSQEDYNRRPAFWRAVAKELNFLVLYKGGAGKAATVIHKKTGEWIPIPTMQKIISGYDEAHQRFREWQEEVLERVIRDHEYRVPLIGFGRTFEGSPDMIRAVYTNEIANIPVQATCAAIALSALNDLRKWLTSNGMRARVVKSIHDGIFTDCPADEVEAVSTEGVKIMETPTYYRQLCDHLGRSVPLEWEVKTLSGPGDLR